MPPLDPRRPRGDSLPDVSLLGREPPFTLREELALLARGHAATEREHVQTPFPLADFNHLGYLRVLAVVSPFIRSVRAISRLAQRAEEAREIRRLVVGVETAGVG